MCLVNKSIVLLYHTCYQNLPDVYKAEVLAHANKFYAQAADMLQNSENIVLYQEKQAVIGLAAVKSDRLDCRVMHLSMLCVSNRFQKTGIGTEILTYITDELQGSKDLHVSIPPLRWNHATLVDFFEKRNFCMITNTSDTTLLVQKAI